MTPMMGALARAQNITRGSQVFVAPQNVKVFADDGQSAETPLGSRPSDGQLPFAEGKFPKPSVVPDGRHDG